MDTNKIDGLELEEEKDDIYNAASPDKHIINKLTNIDRSSDFQQHLKGSTLKNYENAGDIPQIDISFSNNPENERILMSEKCNVMNDKCEQIADQIEEDEVTNSKISIENSLGITNLNNKRENQYLEVDTKRKKQSSEDKKVINTRKNIRDIIDDKNLDANTLAAQKQESERLARVQEQQRVIREIQKQSNIIKSFSRNIESFDLSDNIETPELNDTYVVRGVAQEVTFEGCHFIDVDKSQDTTFDNKGIIINESKHFNYLTKEVVTISDSSDEECIVLSDDDDEEIIKEDEDPQNSGLHVNDLFNKPDEEGRIIVNIGHPPNEQDVYVAPQIARILKPHQIGGIRFLFDNIIESIDRFESSSGFGCILAHSMGLGKTLQIVTFCDILFRHTNSKTILCIMPINTLQNWLNEFNKWLPHSSDDHTDNVRPRTFNVFVLNDQFKTLAARAKVIEQWRTQGGVLLMGYEIFRLLSLKLTTPKRKKNHVVEKKEPIKESEGHKKIKQQLHAALVYPGSDLVICDEGHRIKNSHSSISLALKQIRTKRRIVLTGYPLQNNLLEYWCMVDFVRPNYLGTKTEFCNMFERPIQNGQCIDSTPEDIKFMRQRAHVLHSLLVGFVQRRSHLVLQHALPPKQEFVILLRMTPFQRKLYEVFMNDVVRSKSVPNPLKAFAVCCKIWNHPDVLYNFVKTRQTDCDLEVEEQSSISHTVYKQVNGQATNNKPQLEGMDLKISLNSWKCDKDFNFPTSDSISTYTDKIAVPNLQFSADSNMDVSDIVDLDTKQIKTFPSVSSKVRIGDSAAENISKTNRDEKLSYEWAKELLRTYIPDKIENSPKMVAFFLILNESVKLGDRILVFSQSLLTLNLIEHFLQLNTIPGTTANWSKNTSYYRIDGSTAAMEREKLITEFNKNSSVHLFLVSTKAGSLGINLVGANRVIVFDASWNPCHDTQAVCRVYRYGQQKPCFIYRIVMDNCLEKKIYDRQVNKQGMADRVVDECNPDAHLSLKEVTNLCYDYEQDTEILDLSHCKEKYTDAAIRKILEHNGQLLSREPFCHESQLVDRKEKQLSQAEKRMAQRSYEMAKKAAIKPSSNIPYRMCQTGLNGNKFGARGSRWIPAEVWQRQGMTANEMILPLDVVIPTSSGDKSTFLLKSGQKVMVLKSPKGVYMQLESGKIIAIRTTKINNSNDINPFSKLASDFQESSSIMNNKKEHSSETTMKGKSSFIHHEDNSDDVILISDSSELNTNTTKSEQEEPPGNSEKKAVLEISKRTSPNDFKLVDSEINCNKQAYVNRDESPSQMYSSFTVCSESTKENVQSTLKKTTLNIRNIPAPYPSIYTSMFNQNKDADFQAAPPSRNSSHHIERDSKYDFISKLNEKPKEIDYHADAYNDLHYGDVLQPEQYTGSVHNSLKSSYLEASSHPSYSNQHTYTNVYDNQNSWYSNNLPKPLNNHIYGAYDRPTINTNYYGSLPAHNIGNLQNELHNLQKPADIPNSRISFPSSATVQPSINEYPYTLSSDSAFKWHQE